MSIESDHDLLVQMSTQIEELKRTVENFTRESGADRRQLWNEKSDKDTALDHERRLRMNERFIFIGVGGIFTIQIVLAVLTFVRH